MDNKQHTKALKKELNKLNKDQLIDAAFNTWYDVVDPKSDECFDND